MTGLPSAALFLVYASARNRFARLLRNPRYVIIASLAIGYWLWRQLRAGRDGGSPSVMTIGAVPLSPAAELLVAAIALVVLAVIWSLSSREPIDFSEAEVHFLFSGPVRHRALVQYKLAQSLASMITVIPTTAILAWRQPHPIFLGVGAFFICATISLHGVCASLTSASSAERGRSDLARRWPIVLALVVVVAVANLARMRAFASDHATAIALLSTPLVAPVRAAAAVDLAGFARAAASAVAVLLAHYVWAISSSVSFEEAAADAAEQREKRREHARGRGAAKRAKPFFALAEKGHPAMALYWKNLSAGRIRLWRRTVVLVVVLAALVLPLFVAVRKSPLLIVAATFSCVLALVAAVAGPAILRNDLRLDLQRLDVLRALPLSSRAIVTASLLAPFTLLVAAEWTLLLLAAALPTRFSSGERSAALIAALVVAPAVTACGLVVRNAAALAQPSWMGAHASGRGIVTGTATILLLAALLAPAAAVGWYTFRFLVSQGVGTASIAIAGVLAGTLALALALLATRPLAALLDRFDSAAL